MATLLDRPARTAHRSLPPALPVALAHGDGIGPEIMAATLDMLLAGGARLDIREITLGERLYRSGHSAGIDDAAWAAIEETGLLLKAPITTPRGGGVKSLNVTLRKTLGLFANVRPAVAYAPFVPTLHPGMDVLIVRENEEDLYAGIEHRQTEQVYQCLKLVSRAGCERIVRHAFDLARAQGRRKVTCVTKSNIMKLTDGLFEATFHAIGKAFPDITQEHMIVDIAAARLATQPETFDVIVTTNLYGDILSDIAAEVAGSVGLAPSGNIGAHAAMFEAIHGSAPDIAGQDIANPSGLLLAGVMMLRHGGQHEAAARIHNAWLRAIEDGIATADMRPQGRALGTGAFAQAVIDRMGELPRTLAPVSAQAEIAPTAAVRWPELDAAPAAPEARATPDRALTGIDIFVNAPLPDAQALADRLHAVTPGAFRLEMITNRGVKVWPGGNGRTLLTDHWRCRFMALPGVATSRTAAIELALRLSRAGIDVIKTEQLYLIDGEKAFSLGQGQ